jgi:hypothetical protein
MKKVLIPIEFCNDCRYSVIGTYVAVQKAVLFCDKLRRVLVSVPSSRVVVPSVEIPEDCPLPDFKE